MPSTHLSLHYHIIFCTKGRGRIIAEPWREELHAYIGGITRDIGAIPQSIGGTGDHVHVLLGLKATHTLADALREMKRGSSVWIHQRGVENSYGRKATGRLP
jgi:putative transposase